MAISIGVGNIKPIASVAIQDVRFLQDNNTIPQMEVRIQLCALDILSDYPTPLQGTPTVKAFCEWLMIHAEEDALVKATMMAKRKHDNQTK